MIITFNTEHYPTHQVLGNNNGEKQQKLYDQYIHKWNACINNLPKLLCIVDLKVI